MARGAIVLIQNGCVALIERRRGDHVYYLFPGGQTEGQETAEEAAVREAFEELGMQVRIERLVAVAEFNGKHQEYFIASAIAGELGTGHASELASRSDSDVGSYTPVWMSLAELGECDVRPRTLANALADGLTEAREVLQLQE